MLFNFVEGYAILVSKLKTQAGGVCPPSCHKVFKGLNGLKDGGKNYRLLYNIPSQKLEI